MKTSGPVIVAALLAATVTAASYAGISGGGSGVNGISGGGAQLLVVGPVEAINAANKTAIVLGQRVHTASLERLTVGNTAAVYGTTRADGTIEASVIQSRGVYVPGATSVFISGTVQRAEPSVGRVVVGGVTIDLTSVMSHGTFSPTVGTKLQVAGIQPLNGGLVVVNGISGGGAEALGISGGGGAVINGISGGGGAVINGISGGGGAVINGISGGGGAVVNGISGGGGAVINGISGGGGAVINGISGGGGAVINGISGGGGAVINGISGGGGAVINGISGGGGAVINGISGGGGAVINGISGGGGS